MAVVGTHTKGTEYFSTQDIQYREQAAITPVSEILQLQNRFLQIYSSLLTH